MPEQHLEPAGWRTTLRHPAAIVNAITHAGDRLMEPRTRFSVRQYLPRRAIFASSVAALCLFGQAEAQVRLQDSTVVPTQIAVAPAGASHPNTLIGMPRQIEVFATSAMFIANAGTAVVYRVDERQRLTDDINQGQLPADPQQAQAIAMQRIRAMGPAFRQRVQAAVLTIQKTVDYGIQRVPAIVFDGRLVVHGVTDVAQALAMARSGQAEALQQSPGARP